MIEKGRYRILIEAPGLTLEQGQAMAGREAMRLCGGEARLGHYRWQSDEKLGPPARARTEIGLRLEQEAECGAAPRPPEPRPSGWRATQADVTAVLGLTAEYFADRASGRYRQAWNRLTSSMQEMSPLGEYQARQANSAATAGGGVRRRPIKVTWYDNPADAPVAGIYAAVDFVGESDKLRLICGYVVWLRQSDGSWRLAREEEGIVARSEAEGMSAEQLAEIRQAMSCAEAD